MNLKTSIRIEARLVLTSALHIGATGAQGAGLSHAPTARGGFKDRPYIPGSSLKGRLRTLLNGVDLRRAMRHAPDPLAALFGAPDLRGALSFWDCPLDADWADAREADGLPITEIRGELQARRGAVTRLQEVVTPGATFVFRLGLAARHADGLPPVLAGLRLMEWEGIGAGTSRGMGRVRFADLTIDGRASDALDNRTGRTDGLA